MGKQKVVIDTNLLFSAARSRNTDFRRALYREDCEFFTAKFLIIEILRHKERILDRAKGTEDEVYEYLHDILVPIQFINEMEISTRSFMEAHLLVRNVDENDISFVALSIELDAPLWSNDQQLKIGLRKKGFSNFFEP